MISAPRPVTAAVTSRKIPSVRATLFLRIYKPGGCPGREHVCDKCDWSDECDKCDYHQSRVLLPLKACAIVTPSAYSRSPPTGKPRASLVTLIPAGAISR